MPYLLVIRFLVVFRKLLVELGIVPFFGQISQLRVFPDAKVKKVCHTTQIVVREIVGNCILQSYRAFHAQIALHVKGQQLEVAF